MAMHSPPEDTSILGPPYQPTKLYVGYVYRPGGRGGGYKQGRGRRTAYRGQSAGAS